MRKGDITACIFILFLGVLLLYLQVGTDTADTVEIYSNGILFGKYDIFTEATVNVATTYGENTVCVENGQVYVTSSTCEDKDEIMQGKISRSGQSLICLPNKLIVTVKGRGENVDSISY